MIINIVWTLVGYAFSRTFFYWHRRQGGVLLCYMGWVCTVWSALNAIFVIIQICMGMTIEGGITFRRPSIFI